MYGIVCIENKYANHRFWQQQQQRKEKKKKNQNISSVRS